MDLNTDGFVEENELRDHINFMQKRYVNNDVERTWKNYKEDKIQEGKLAWKDYRLVGWCSHVHFHGYFQGTRLRKLTRHRTGGRA